MGRRIAWWVGLDFSHVSICIGSRRRLGMKIALNRTAFPH